MCEAKKSNENIVLKQKIKKCLELDEQIHIIHQQHLNIIRILIYFITGIILSFIIIISYFVNVVLFVIVSITLIFPCSGCFGAVWYLISANNSYIFTNLKIIILKQQKRIILIPYKAISSIEQIRYYFRKRNSIMIKFNEDASKFIIGNMNLERPFFITRLLKDNKLFEEINQLRNLHHKSNIKNSIT